MAIEKWPLPVGGGYTTLGSLVGGAVSFLVVCDSILGVVGSGNILVTNESHRDRMMVTYAGEKVGKGRSELRKESKASTGREARNELIKSYGRMGGRTLL